jgi:hypothetical protein
MIGDVIVIVDDHVIVAVIVIVIGHVIVAVTVNGHISRHIARAGDRGRRRGR